MDLSLTPDQETFRATVRAWLAQNIPSDWKPMGSSEIPRKEQYELLRGWQRSLFEAGFIGLTWPKEYGGRGLTFMEELILQQEMAVAKAPRSRVVRTAAISEYSAKPGRIQVSTSSRSASTTISATTQRTHRYTTARLSSRCRQRRRASQRVTVSGVHARTQHNAAVDPISHCRVSLLATVA